MLQLLQSLNLHPLLGGQAARLAWHLTLKLILCERIRQTARDGTVALVGGERECLGLLRLELRLREVRVQQLHLLHHVCHLRVHARLVGGALGAVLFLEV